jgi:predicted regulator of Ras-like GTPase activity (Roadblock/LC7/MglB family)
MIIGSVSEISLKTGNGTIVLIFVGPKAILTVLTEMMLNRTSYYLKWNGQAEQVENILQEIL